MITSQSKTVTHSFTQTRDLGRRIGSLLSAGTILALIGDLGSGKTCLVQGIARGLDVPDDYYITSPSYTLINEYPGRIPLFHVDLYRLDDPIDFNDIGLYDILDDAGVIAIEWADKLKPDDLVEYLSIAFEIQDDESRKISLTAYGLQAVNLLKELEKT